MVSGIKEEVRQLADKIKDISKRLTSLEDIIHQAVINITNLQTSVMSIQQDLEDDFESGEWWKDDQEEDESGPWDVPNDSC